MAIRRSFLASLLLGSGWLGLGAAMPEVNLVRVWPGYRDTASFVSIGEYLGGGSSPASARALRTRPDHRAGYYWMIRTRTRSAVAGAQIELKVIRSGSTEPHSHTFDYPIPAGSKVIHVGFTGEDWSDQNETPLAWHLSLWAPGGTLLATTQSFLWPRAES